jgi:predicted amidohydrolase
LKIEVAVAQIKPHKGDYAANLQRIGEIFAQIEEEAPQTQVIVLPETVLSGYFLEGGVRDVARSSEALFADLLHVYRERVSRESASLDICVGFYELFQGKYYNSSLYATLSTEGASDPPCLLHTHRKFFLPTYGVFDEKRFVSRGRTLEAFDTRYGRVAMLICEDVWHSISATIAALKGALTVYVLSASPGREFSGHHIGNIAQWNVLLPAMAEEHNVWVVYAGLIGFEGGKGFTGSSQVVDPWGNTVVTAPVTEEALLFAPLDMDDVAIARANSPLLADLEAALGDIAMQIQQVAQVPYRTS